MKFGILGSGNVGQTLGAKLVELGHQVKMGSSDASKLADWLQNAGHGATAGSYTEAAAFGEILINALRAGEGLERLKSAGAANLSGKILIDTSNSLDFSQGRPPRLLVANDDSLAEQIQRAFPESKVVKTLNTVNTSVMVNPGSLTDPDHSIFVSGDDAQAKAQVTSLLKVGFGWQSVIDLGDIRTARTVEMYLPLWITLRDTLGTARFNIKIVT
jgi:8-hydroxy-5-deazaflavin:NADPH oxidoreductase